MLQALYALSAVAFAPGAPRYWPEFGGARAVSLLDGTWSYGYIDGWNSGFDSMSKSFSPTAGATPNKTTVPSCMDVVAGGAPGYLGPRGVAMYRTSFAARSSDPVRLQFQACSFYCRVWVNGKEIGDHRAGGYVAFHLDVPAETLRTDGEGNDLFVLADNRFNSTTAPMHTGGDFWHYGGIIRSVELHTMSATNPVLWRAYVLPAASDVARAEQAAAGAPDTVDVTLVLSDERASGKKLAVRLFFDGGGAFDMTLTVSGHTAFIKGLRVPNASPWSPASPHLHTLTVSVYGGTVTERFGLRRFGVDPATSRLTINGKITKLVGWNHHTQWPVTAASPTDAQLDADILLLQRGHANLVRGAHYPHDPRMIDRLDESGILFWSETLGPAVGVGNTLDWEHFMKHQLVQMQEMLDNAINHAAIFTWGWFNEGPSSDKRACPAYGACAKLARDQDPTRFGTWADSSKLKGVCFEHATLISFNDYPGWYDFSGNASAPLSYWDPVAAAVQQGTTASGSGTLGKPMLISETGSGGIFEWDDNTTVIKWALNYQTVTVSS